MPQGRFNEYSLQEQAALARDMLQKSGRPITANNLNAAMLALMRNEELPSNNLDAAIERTMQPRRPAQPAQPARNVQMLNQDVDAEAALADGDPNADGNSSMRDVREAGSMPVTEQQAVGATRGAQVAAGQPAARRAGTINSATRIDEENPEAGMFEGAPPRQADETGVDQIGLGLTLLSPLLAALGLPGIAARGGSAMTAPANTGAQYMGRAPFQANPGRVMDVAPNAIAGQSQRMLTGPRGQLPAPAAPNAQAATPPAQVGSARQGQAQLPRPDADLRRRMIDRNMQRSERNAARTRDERAAGNSTKGRRERIERVPEGEASPPRRSGTIRLPPSRRRVSETAGKRRDAMRDE
jgi:hypothetical protein